MDKNVDTFEQNKCFLSASFRNFKKHLFFVDSQPPSPPCSVDTFTWLQHWKGERGVEMSKLHIEKLTRLTKQVFFGECLNCFCPRLTVAREGSLGGSHPTHATTVCISWLPRLTSLKRFGEICNKVHQMYKETVLKWALSLLLRVKFSCSGGKLRWSIVI